PSSGSRRPCRVMFHHDFTPSTDHMMVTTLVSSSDQTGGLTRIRSSVIPRPRPPGTYSAMYLSTNVRAHPGFVTTRSTTKIFSSAISRTYGRRKVPGRPYPASREGFPGGTNGPTPGALSDCGAGHVGIVPAVAHRRVDGLRLLRPADEQTDRRHDQRAQHEPADR